MDLKVNKRRLFRHIKSYGLAYAAVIIAVTAGVIILLQVTAPPVPKENALYVTVVGPMNDIVTEHWAQESASIVPEGKVIFDSLPVQVAGAYQGMELLMLRMSQHDGDVFILPYDYYRMMALGDTLTDISYLAEDGQVQLGEGADLQSLNLNEQLTDGQTFTGIYGLPLDGLAGITYLVGDAKGMIIAIPNYSTRQDSAVAFVKWLFEQKRQSP